MEKLHLKGETDSPEGRAPLAAWQAVEEAVRRPEDAWIKGDPLTLLSHPRSWQLRIRGRVENPAGAFGLRLRFVFQRPPSQAVELTEMVSEVLTALPESSNSLFIHAEIMDGPESGIYVAYENRPPALITQIHLEGKSVFGEVFTVDPELAIHLNILLHNKELGFHQALNDETVQQVLLALAQTVGKPIDICRIHGLSIARSDSRSAGISVGLEAIRQDKGSRGGFSALESGSRSILEAGTVGSASAD